ncbi:MAG: hypothetical protein ACN6OP_19285 [Pseudomonadales bacterium]
MTETDSKGFNAEAFYRALAATVTARNVTWKAVSDETGVSATTLTRMAQSRKPDASSLAVLATWANLSINDFVTIPGRTQADPEPLAAATAIFGSDPRLTPAARQQMINVIESVYRTLEKTA